MVHGTSRRYGASWSSCRSSSPSGSSRSFIDAPPTLGEGRVVASPLHRSRDQEQASRPCGSARVQLRVVPFSVIVAFAVAVPSYVTTSRRETVVGVWPV